LGSDFAWEVWKRGWSHAEKKVVMGDGAEWIWNLAEPYFPGAAVIFVKPKSRMKQGSTR
jgi:hypothetical protein